jgi:hypothetical protein
VLRQLRIANLIETIGARHFFLTVADAVGFAATSAAAKEAAKDSPLGSDSAKLEEGSKSIHFSTELDGKASGSGSDSERQV